MSARRSSILFAIALILAAACGPAGTSGTSGSPGASPSASAGGAASTLVIDRDTSDLISLDPAVLYEFSAVFATHNVYETLVKFEGTDLSTIKPGLATSWDIKDTGSTNDITFKLKSGQKFASGNPVTADDVVYSVQRAIKLNKSPAFLFTDIAGLKADSVKATDPTTVVFSLPKTASASAFLTILTFTIGGVVDSKDVKAKETGGDSGGIVQDGLRGNGKKVQGIIPRGLAGYNEATPFQADVTKAKALLTEAGETSVTLDFLVPTGQAPGGVAFSDLAAKLKSDWAKIGVTVNIKQTTTADLLATYRAQKGQLVLIYWGPDYPDPDANVGPFTDYKAKSIGWRNAWDDPTIAQKGRDAALITDPAKRAAAYKDITDYVLHNGPYVVLYQPSELFGLRSNVKGFNWSAIGWAELASVTK